MQKRTLEIVTSALNEQDCLPELFRRLNEVLSPETKYEWQITVFDNGSRDRTWELITREAMINPRVRGFRMSRTFNLDAALTAGLDLANSDIVVLMTSDLQDPPESIPLLLREYEKGFEQVLVKVTKRDHVPFIRRLMSKFFYRSANWMTDGMLPEMVSDFRLLDRKVYESLRNLRESHRFLRGLGAWVGFSTSSIEIERSKRYAGESKWLKSSLKTVIEYAIKSIYSHTSRPLMWVSYLGIFLSISSFIYLAFMSTLWILTDTPFNGFGTIVGFVVLGFAITLSAIGVLAQYIALIFEEVKGRPIYIIADSTK